MAESWLGKAQQIVRVLVAFALLALLTFRPAQQTKRR